MLELGDGIYRVSGKASIDDVNELLSTELPDEEWDTVAGLMLDLLGRMPDDGRGGRVPRSEPQGGQGAGTADRERADHAAPDENGEGPEMAT